MRGPGPIFDLQCKYPSPPGPLSPKRGEGGKEIGPGPLSPKRGEGRKEISRGALAPGSVTSLKPGANAPRLMLILSGLVSTLLAAVGPTPAPAQVFWRGDAMSVQAELLPPPRELRQLVRRAVEAIDNDQPTDAMILLGDWLAGEGELPADQDYYVAIDSWLRRGGPAEEQPGSGVPAVPEAEEPAGLTDREGFGLPGPAGTRTGGRRSLRGYIADGLGSLPPETLDRYEDRHGPSADRMLREAAADRDWDEIGEVRRRFFHTRAGYRATAMLAAHQWSTGNPVAAERLLESLVPWRRAAEVRGNSGQRVSADLQRRSPSTISTLGAEASRNDTDAGEMPIGFPAWWIETTDSQRQQDRLAEQIDRLRGAGELAPPSWSPVVWQPAGDGLSPRGDRPRPGTQVVVRTAGRVWGIDAATGKRLWPYPVVPPALEEEIDPDDQFAVEPETAGPADSLNLIFNDLPHGGLAVDDSRVYFLDDLPEFDIPQFHPLGLRQRSARAMTGNTLVALELPSEGKLLWRRGLGSTVLPTAAMPSGQPGGDGSPDPGGIFRGAVRAESSLDDVFFLGPPLPHDGRLYVLAEAAGEIALICINPADGQEIYRQVLTVVPAGSIAADPLRRICGAVPTMHQGVMICPTAAGITVAFDPTTRQILWAFQHRRNVQWLRPGRNGESPSMGQLAGRWSHPAAIAHGRHVVLTPVESDRWMVLDLVTGQPRFSPRARLMQHYVAGIRDGAVILAGPQSVTAHDADSGQLRWTTAADLVPPGHVVSGRGVFSLSGRARTCCRSRPAKSSRSVWPMVKSAAGCRFGSIRAI